MGVDVVDVGRLQARVLAARASITRAIPSPSSEGEVMWYASLVMP